jgi:hypothetical protein
MVDHAALPDRYHPATIALPALAGGRLLSATRSGIGWICAAPCGVLASARLVDLHAIRSYHYSLTSRIVGL